MGFCANCGRQRDGAARFCASCGTEFTESSGHREETVLVDHSAAPGDPDAGGTAGAEPVNPASGSGDAAPVTRLDLNAGGTGGPPDPFQSWYRPESPAEATDASWMTQTVGTAPARSAPDGYGPPPVTPVTPPVMPYAPVPPNGGGPGGRGRRGPLFVVLALILVLAAGGVAYALASSLGKHPAGAPAAGGSSPAASSPAAASPSPSASASASPSASPSVPAGLVTVAPAVTSSATHAVQALLSQYFGAINAHDYARYRSTLTAAVQAKQTEQTFNQGYSTTTDSGMTLTTLASSGSGQIATVTFTSHQAAAQSVDKKSTCNQWTLNFYLVPQGAGYLIGPAPAGYQPDYADC